MRSSRDAMPVLTLNTQPVIASLSRRMDAQNKPVLVLVVEVILKVVVLVGVS